ncbi:type 2 lactosamine alpha-2,3-sialyltransferase-like [Pristis pectinata]|uniref:type 2 lactosamine alpha-2,3-sialyltransferase-like n=1 Tax=Pristis pectinata TaxID=685728 RepID=UPI00223CE6C5|nr:type 2 lactosamine alpha-2,3-sialyltransferase-like [Pristis pectinata]XP_051871010.1 type 2 lactosamine alpha-2,3-sialyltransferase-like [Pristis pectinata]XP_051871012.1 type 2 lactosamine alpha-2,3-sialyltransferase-like [Pristis pectinata]XP_051871013.1 type 2 lactosamine alpha-2,3-sialyltransferase-like [Pristis pectinata]XP_051871014.1 type 2 lactosamine alpha-2,3-sialyltransferase-like [Pristis pectinata]
MKRRRYIKLMVVLLMFLAIFFYYIFNYKYSGGVHGRNVTLILQFTGVKKKEVIPTKRENRNPFLCPSDISYKSWPTTRMTMPETLPFGTLSTERYFQAALNNLQHCDLPDQLKNLSCLRCIVIGNGGVLRNRTLGKKINSYDVVIRLNNGPVIGYENDVGNKTTFRFCYPESIFNDHSQHDANTTMVFVPFKAVDLRWLKEVLLKKKVSLRGFWKKPPMELTYKNTQIRILNPSVVQKAAFKLLNLPKVFPGPKPPQYPTTGIIAISMALTMCDEVHIAGFKYDNKNPNSTLHYYGNETMSAMRKMLYHNVTAEQKLLNELKSSNRIFDLIGNF